MKYFQSRYPWLIYVFWLLAGLNLYANLTYNFELELITKPLLIPILGSYFYINTQETASPLKMWLLGALFFSWAGDSFLLYQNDKIFFMMGLGSFLVAHILYIIAFKKSMQGEIEWTGRIWLRAIPFLGVAAVMFTFLYDSLDKVMLVAVPIYIVVIVIMAFLAMERAGKVIRASADIVFYGAFFFLVSDAVLAIHTFVRAIEIPIAQVIVMATYLLAQFLIIWGMLIQLKSKG